MEQSKEPRSKTHAYTAFGLRQRPQEHTEEKRSFFSKWSVKLDMHMQKNEIDPLTSHKNQFRM